MMGWTPGEGLGKEGTEGRRVPVKVQLKNDTVGLGTIQYTSHVTRKRKTMEAEIVRTDQEPETNKVRIPSQESQFRLIQE